MAVPSALPTMVAAGRVMNMDTKTAADKAEVIAMAEHKIMAGQAGGASQNAVLVMTNSREIIEETGNPMVANRVMVMTSVPRVADTAAVDRECMEAKEDVGQCPMIILEIMEISIAPREKVTMVVANRDGADKEDMAATSTAEIKENTVVSKDTAETGAMAVSKVMGMEGVSKVLLAVMATRAGNRNVAETTGKTRAMEIRGSTVISNPEERDVLQEGVEMDRVTVAGHRIKARVASHVVLNPVVHPVRTKGVATQRKVRQRVPNDKH